MLCINTFIHYGGLVLILWLVVSVVCWLTFMTKQVGNERNRWRQTGKLSHIGTTLEEFQECNNQQPLSKRIWGGFRAVRKQIRKENQILKYAKEAIETTSWRYTSMFCGRCAYPGEKMDNGYCNLVQFTNQKIVTYPDCLKSNTSLFSDICYKTYFMKAWDT